MWRRQGIGLAALLIGVAPIFPVRAEAVDGNKPLLCALVDISSCAPSESGVACEKETPESANAPRFLRINVADKTISGTRPDGQQRQMSIATVQRVENRLLLQGMDEGPLTWSIAIVEATGQMALTGTRTDAGFVVFGACTEP